MAVIRASMHAKPTSNVSTRLGRQRGRLNIIQYSAASPAAILRVRLVRFDFLSRERLGRTRVIAALGLQHKLDSVSREAAAIAVFLLIGLVAQRGHTFGGESDLGSFDFAVEYPSGASHIRSCS